MKSPYVSVQQVEHGSEDVFVFGDFALDPQRRGVWRRDGAAVPLTPRVFNALSLLVEHSGRLLEKEWLLSRLWPGLVVEENSLSQVISTLRRALGDSALDRRYIQTEPRRGFRFVAPVTRMPVSKFAGGERRRTSKPEGRAEAIRETVAVLPFVSLSAPDELLELGMADSLIARLSGQPGLIVRSVSSVRRFVGLDQDALAAAQALKVDWVVEGTLRHRDGRLYISARLLSALDGSAAWSGSFDEKFSNVFDVQGAIAERVAGALTVHFRSAAMRRPSANDGGTRDVQAYRHYLAGQQHVQASRADSLRFSIVEFERALAIDPNYALARVGMIESMRRMVWGADARPIDAFDAPRTWLLQLLDTTPHLAEAQCQMALTHYFYDWDWSASARLFRKALALNPNLAAAHFGLGSLLVNLGRNEEGLRHVDIACDLDPMDLLFNARYACYLAGHGDDRAAWKRLAWALEVGPNYWPAHMAAAAMRMLDGDLQGAIDAARRSCSLADESTQPVGFLGVLHARAGQSSLAYAVLEVLEERARHRFVPPTQMAAIHAALGDHGAALSELEEAFRVRDTRLTYLKDDPRWMPLRSEPRFSTLLRHLKLDGYGPGLTGP